MLVGWKRTSLALGLIAGMSTTTWAQAPAKGRNQATAEAVAMSLGSSRSLAKYRIEIEAKDGVVTLAGAVSNTAQKAEAMDRARQVVGVSSVVDKLMSNDSRVRPAQYQPADPRLALGGHGHHQGAYAGVGGGAIEGGTVTSSVASDPFAGGPAPEGAAGMVGASQASSPGAPNYAWPSYAPGNNYSAVGYPTAYPWQAWPNIGPFNPYPEVPLDWRAVTLRWDDGIWWLDFKKHYTRPFFTPYPFGIFAY
jgi:hypothetical protein